MHHHHLSLPRKQHQLVFGFKDWLDKAIPRQGVSEEVHDKMMSWLVPARTGHFDITEVSDGWVEEQASQQVVAKPAV